MKIMIILSMSFCLLGCSLFAKKRAPEVVASCFSDGENQELYCKAQRVNEANKIVVTRCIGTKNREADPVLRGKCVEKICSEGSNTDCQVRGEMAVLQQYSDLLTARQFASDVEPLAKSPAKTKNRTKNKLATTTEVDVDPSVRLTIANPSPKERSKPVQSKASAARSPASAAAITQEPAEMKITLMPAKAKKKARSPASVKSEEGGFKKVCVAKGDMEAPAVLRGKCATRSCSGGKCSYQGRKEIFDFASRSPNKEK